MWAKRTRSNNAVLWYDRGMPKRSWLLLSTLALASCATGPTAQDTLPRLKAALASPVSSPEQNADNSALTEQVSQGKHLHGLTRIEVQERIGAGDPCGRHPMCIERGFEDDDWFYEVGRAGEGYTVRYRPALIVGFNRFGKVERTFVLRTE